MEINPMNKKIISTTVAIGAAISVGAIADNTAHASDTTSNQDGLVVTTKQPTNPTVTKEQVSKAQTNYTNTNNKLTDAQAKAKANLTSTNNIKSSLDTTKQNIEDVKNAKSTLVDIDKKVATNKNLIDKATESKEKTATEVVNKTKEVKDLKEKVDNTSTTVKSLQDKKDNLEKEVNTLSGTDESLNEKQAKLDKAKDVKQKTTEVLNKKQEDLEKAKVDNVKTQQNIDAINSDIKVTEQELSNTNNTLEKQKVTEKAALDELNKLRKSTFGTANTELTLDPAFVSALQTYLQKVKGISYSDPNFMSKIEQAAKPVIAVERNTKKVSRPSEYKYKQVDLVDITHMSQEDQDNFAQYFAQLLNQVRAQFGKEPIKVNKNTQELARRISNNIMKDNFIQADHYIKGILDAARSMNLKAYAGQNHYESLYTGYVSSDRKPLLPRAYIYDQIRYWTQHFFYEGALTGSYLHATALVNSEDNIGLGFSFMADSESSRQYSTLKMSVINVHKYLTDSSTYHKKYSKSSKDALEPIKSIDTTKYEQAYNKAKEEVETTTIKLNSIQQQLNTKNKELAENKAKLVDVQVLEQDITKANTLIKQVDLAIDNLEKEIKVIRDNLASANEVLKAKTQELEKTTKELKENEDKLSSESTKYKESVKTLEDEKAKLEKVTNLLTELDNSLTELSKQKQELLDKVSNLDKYKEELAKLTQELAASEVLDEELAKNVEKLTKDAANDLAEYNKLLKQYQLENLVYAVTQDAPVVEPIEFDINSLNKPQDEKPLDNVNKPNKPTKANSTNTTNYKQQNHKQNNTNAKVLPKTGTESNNATGYAFLLTLLAGFGLKLKRKED